MRVQLRVDSERTPEPIVVTLSLGLQRCCTKDFQSRKIRFERSLAHLPPPCLA